MSRRNRVRRVPALTGLSSNPSRRQRGPSGVALGRACDAALAAAGGFEGLEARYLMAAAPVIVFNFDEGVADPNATTVTNTGSSGATQNGTLTGDALPWAGPDLTARGRERYSAPAPSMKATQRH